MILESLNFSKAKIYTQLQELELLTIWLPNYVSDKTTLSKPIYGALVVYYTKWLRRKDLLMENLSTSNKKEIIHSIVKGEIADLPSGYSSFINELVKVMLSKEPDDRPTITQILELGPIEIIVVL